MRSSSSAWAWAVESPVPMTDPGSPAVVLLSGKDIISGQAPRPGEPTPPLHTITDANGGWQLDAVDPGRYRVSATAVSFIPVTNEVRIAGRGEQTGINLAMVMGGALLSGTISDIGGGPIESVLVRINDTSQLNLGFNQVPMAVISDENGEYRVQLPTGSYSVTTSHTDYVAEARATQVPEGSRPDYGIESSSSLSSSASTLLPKSASSSDKPGRARNRHSRFRATLF
jgi:hypothetical protein